MKKYILIASLAMAFAGCASTSGRQTVESPAVSETETLPDESMMIPENAQKSPNGYAYAVMKAGSGVKPDVNDAVKVHLRVLNVEGNVVDENTATIAMAHSIPFLEEMLPLMEVGEMIRVWGESQARIWEIEIVEIDESYRAPEDAASAPEDALTLEGIDGVKFRVIEAGNGENASFGQALRIQASRWKTTGAILESNRASRGMIVFLNEESQQLDPVHNALLQQMNVGSHVRVWIPAAMIGTDYDLVEDMWLVERLEQLEAPANLAQHPDDALEIADGAWMRIETQNDVPRLVENDAVEVDMTCWNAATGALVDAAYLREKHDVMEIKPALGVWFDIMKQAAPGVTFMTWIKASALPEQVNMDLTCRVILFDKV